MEEQRKKTEQDVGSFISDAMGKMKGTMEQANEMLKTLTPEKSKKVLIEIGKKSELKRNILWGFKSKPVEVSIEAKATISMSASKTISINFDNVQDSETFYNYLKCQS